MIIFSVLLSRKNQPTVEEQCEGEARFAELDLSRGYSTTWALPLLHRTGREIKVEQLVGDGLLASIKGKRVWTLGKLISFILGNPECCYAFL